MGLDNSDTLQPPNLKLRAEWLGTLERGWNPPEQLGLQADTTEEQ